MATIIDALVVTLGLDPKKFNQGRDKFVNDFRKSKDDAKKITSEMTEDERAAAGQRTDIAKKEAASRSEYARRLGMTISKVRNEALALLGVFTAGMGIKNFIGNTISTEASLGRLSENLSMSATDLGSWQLAAKNAGGTVEGMTAQLKESADAVANFKAGFGADAGMQFFFRMGGSTEDLRDGNTYLLKRAEIVASIYKTDRQRAAVVAQGMGLDSAQFNLYKLGPEGIAQRRREQEGAARTLAANAAQAEALRRKYDTATNRLESVGVSVVNAMMPGIDLVVNKIIELGNWVVAHKDEVNAAISSFVRGFEDFIRQFDKLPEKWEAFKKTPVGRLVNAAIDAIAPGSDREAATTKNDHVSMKSRSSKVKSLGTRYDDPKLNDYATQVEKREGLPAGILNSLKNQGEKSNSNAVSPAGAMGVMQFMPKSWDVYGKGDPFDPYASIDAAGRYVKDLMKRYNGDIEAAITEYNGGVRQARAVQAGGVPWVPETIAYLDRVRRGMGSDSQVATGSVSKPAVGIGQSLYASRGAPVDSTLAIVNAAQSPPQKVTNSTTNSTSSHETNFNGPITIQTQAADGHGIMQDLIQTMGSMTLSTQANTGLR